MKKIDKIYNVDETVDIFKTALLEYEKAVRAGDEKKIEEIRSSILKAIKGVYVNSLKLTKHLW